MTGEKVMSLHRPDPDAVRVSLQKLANKGIKSLAVVFFHSYAYVYPGHERVVEDIAKYMGCFAEISLSHEVRGVVRVVRCGNSASTTVYLTRQSTE